MTTQQERILVPVDGSEASDRALDYAVRLGAGLGLPLDVVTVLDLSQVDVYDGFYLTDRQLEELQTKARKDILERAHARVPDDGPNVSTRLLRGRTARVIEDEAGKPGVQLIVMGRTGKGAFERVLQGSVSRDLAAHSPVPVTIVG
jgi:nucleotide-binding universal stress UspA family protein